MANETPRGHFQYPDVSDLRWYENGRVIEVDGTVAEQEHDGIVDWLNQLEIRLTGIVDRFEDLPTPDGSRIDPRTGNERIYLVRNRDTFYRDTGDEWVVTGGDEGDAVGAGFGLVLDGAYELDTSADIDWTGVHHFGNDTSAFIVEDQQGNPSEPGEFTRDGGDVKVYTGGVVKSLSDIGTGDGGGTGVDVVSSPNMNIPYTELEDTQRVAQPVTMADGQTITVDAWGVTDTDGDTPAGLHVELLNESGDVVESANTAWETGNVASYNNNTGGLVAAKLAIRNDTGGDYTDPDGVGAQFGYRVE